MNQTIQSNVVPPSGGDYEAGRSKIRAALNWVLVPVSAGTIANVAVTTVSSAIGGPASLAIVGAAVVGAAAAKYMLDKDSSEQSTNRSQ